MAICVGNIIYQAEEACTDIELFVIGLGGLMVRWVLVLGWVIDE